MKALVTGGTGFIGHNLTQRLIRDGWDVLITGKSGEQRRHGQSVGYHFHKLNWHDIGRVDVVFHQAAITDTTVFNKEAMFETNTWNALTLMRNAIEHGCRQIVYASSCAVYGNMNPPFREDGPCKPLNVYGESKKLLDICSLALGLAKDVNVIGLRYSNVFGPHEEHKGTSASMVTQIATQIKNGKRPKLFRSGEQVRDWVYVKDVIEYNLVAARYQGCEIFNAGSGKATSFNEIVQHFNDLWGTDVSPEYIDNPYEGVYQDFTLTDMRTAEAKLGIRSTWPLEAALADCYRK